MNYVSHPLIKPNKVESRLYQENIFYTAIRRNTLCVLPTGLGKTTIAALVAADRLEKHPEKKILIMSPTRPLCDQHSKYFKENLNIPEEETVLVTGFINPSDREIIYRKAKIIVATPQTIENDVRSKIINLNDFSLLVFDECHRSIGYYAYTFIADAYKDSNGLILGLTASPGGSTEKIKEICKNLNIESVEVRTETDPDVSQYVKKMNFNVVTVELPYNLKDAQSFLKTALRNRLEKLKGYEIHVNRQSDLLKVQKSISNKLRTEKKPINFYLVVLLTECIKIWHLLELMETQSIGSAIKYIEKIKEKKTRSDKMILLDNFVKSAISIVESSEEHPKIEKIKELIGKELVENKNVSIIVFSHFRDNVFNLHERLKEICKPVVLIGQAGEKGLTQKEQIDVIKDFNAGYFNCLITTPIGEEGLHIPSADVAIFYDSVPSEIRSIQRRGRVGRTKVGKIIFLITKGTRDEGNYWSSYRKEKNMKAILKGMQKKEENLSNFVKV